MIGNLQVESGANTASFVYDHAEPDSGDGRMVMATRDGVATTYVGNYPSRIFNFEWENSKYTKYYYTGSQRIAYRTNKDGGAIVKFILGDHLGSTTTILHASGEYFSRTGYKPWGEERYLTAAMNTDYRYTGQRLDTSTSSVRRSDLGIC